MLNGCRRFELGSISVGDAGLCFGFAYAPQSFVLDVAVAHICARIPWRLNLVFAARKHPVLVRDLKPRKNHPDGWFFRGRVEQRFPELLNAMLDNRVYWAKWLVGLKDKPAEAHIVTSRARIDCEVVY